MSLKEMYYYLFYKFYRLLNTGGVLQEQTRIKAAMCIAFLEIWLAFSIINYYDIAVPAQGLGRYYQLKLIIFVIVVIVKWLSFFRGDAWKRCISRFDALPAETNSKGTQIVLWLAVFIVVNFIFSYFLKHSLMGVVR